jgi:hypothetical protein
MALAIAFVACTTSKADRDTEAGTNVADANSAIDTPCDPLAPNAITLGTIVGVGEDVADTLYVDSANGIFVSGAGRLNRQHVTGTGQLANNEFLFTFEPPESNDSGVRNLLVETTGTTASAMALGPADSKAFLGQSDAGVTPLALVDAATLVGISLVNTPNVIDYVADVSNGDVLLATLPMNEDTTSDTGGLAIFYGPPDAVAECTITGLEESLGNDGTVTFLVDRTPYVLAFGTMSAPGAGSLGVFTLEGLTPQGGAQLGVTLRSPTPTALPSGLAFSCLP